MAINNINNILTCWYADPLNLSDLHKLTRQAQVRLEQKSQRGLVSFSGILMQMVSDWWLHEAGQHFPARGMFYASSRRKIALYHLVAGQLMISCKLANAMDYLDMGLRHADGLVSSEHYFHLYNRHEELRFLKLSPHRVGPYTLIQLLNESRVMRKLSPNSQYSIPKQ